MKIVVETLGVALYALSQLYGGNLGLAILTLSLIVRLALLPLTLGLTRRAQEQQAKLRRLQPEIDRLNRRYRNDPERLGMETLKLYRKSGYNPLDLKGLLGNLAQLPLGFGLFQAIGQGLGQGSRFLWIGDLAQPDVLLTLLTGVLTLAASLLAPDLPRQYRLLLMALPALVTVFFMWRLAAGIGLYWAASTAVSLAQAAWLRRKTG